jgi:hypothetical protein
VIEVELGSTIQPGIGTPSASVPLPRMLLGFAAPSESVCVAIIEVRMTLNSTEGVEDRKEEERARLYSSDHNTPHLPS